MNVLDSHQAHLPRDIAASSPVVYDDFVPLADERRTHVPTALAAKHLSFQPQTLRAWACSQSWPEGLQPLRIGSRLLWPVAGIRKLLGVERAAT